MLPAYFPKSRILGFGFDLAAEDAPIDFEGAALALLEVLHEDRGEGCVNPIVFIGHGCGAVVIEILLSKKFDKDPAQKELITAQEAIAASTASVILFGPPVDDPSEIIAWTEKSLKLPNASRFMGIKGTSKLPDIWNGFSASVRELEIMANMFVYVYKEKKSNETLSSLQGAYSRSASSPQCSIFLCPNRKDRRKTGVPGF